MPFIGFSMHYQKHAITAAICSIAFCLYIFFLCVVGGYLPLCGAGVPGIDEVPKGLMCGEFWLNRYQGLFIGVLGVAAGLLAYFGLRDQIRQTEDHALRDGKNYARCLQHIIEETTGKLERTRKNFEIGTMSLQSKVNTLKTLRIFLRGQENYITETVPKLFGEDARQSVQARRAIGYVIRRIDYATQHPQKARWDSVNDSLRVNAERLTKAAEEVRQNIETYVAKHKLSLLYGGLRSI